MEIITTHKNTDFDGLASVIAGTLLYPNAVGIVPKAVNKNVNQFLSTHKTAFNIALPNEIDTNRVERLIVMDTNQWRRLDRMDGLRRRNVPVHLWDHHLHDGDIPSQWQCVEQMGATTTLLVREIKRRGLPLSPLSSTILLIGIYEDTGHLTYPSTQAEDAAAASFLLASGADLNIASYFLNPPYEEAQKTVLLKLLENTEIFTHRKTTVGVNVIALEQKVPMLSAVVTMYRKLTNTDAVFIIFINDENCCTIIGRSASEKIDAGALLSHFGGGGHRAAASATVRERNIDGHIIKERLIKHIHEDRITTAVTVADLMSSPVISAPADMPMFKVREIMEDHSFRGIIIETDGVLEGIIVISDMKKLKRERQWKSPVKAFMVRNPICISPDAAPAEAAKIMIRNSIGHLPVQTNGKTIGILTRTDILTFFYDLPQD